MRAPALFGIIVLIHATAIGLFSLMQGCATRRPGEGMAGSPAATERASTETTGPGATLPAATVTPGLPGTPPPPKRNDLKPVTPPKPALVAHTPRVTPVKTPVTPAPKKALPKEGTPYEIKSGDVLSKIAASYGVSTLELASYNGLSNPGAIRKGQKIMIPPGATKKPAATVTASTLSGTPAPVTAAAPAAPAAPALKADEYKVQSGDILGRIAARHGVSTSALKKANNLTSDSLKVGSILKIPAATPATPAAKTPPPEATPVLTPVLPATPTVVTPPPPVHPAAGTDAEVTPPPAVVPPATPVSSDLSKPFEYVVPDNESLDDIARMFIVTPDSIRKLNSLGPTEAVKAGQRIKIPPSQY